MKITNERLKLLVEELNLIPKERLDAAFKLAQENNRPLGLVLVESDLISDDHLGQLIAGQLGIDFVDLDQEPIDPEVLNLIPKVMAKAQKVIAFGRDQNAIKLAMVNPSDLTVINLIEKKTGLPVIPYYTTYQNIENVIAKYQKGIRKEFANIIQENMAQASAGAQAEDLPIVKIVDTILEYAYENIASDIHLEPAEEKVLIRFRIDGILHDIIDLPKNFHELIVTRIKIMAQLRTYDHRSAQDRKIRIKFDQ